MKTTSPKKIYIAGQVTGLPKDKVIAKFFKAQQELESLGYEAVNPIRVVNDWQTDWQTAMKMCINALLECHAVYALTDWEQSRGAKLEIHICDILNIRVYEDLGTLKRLVWNN